MLKLTLAGGLLFTQGIKLRSAAGNLHDGSALNPADLSLLLAKIQMLEEMYDKKNETIKEMKEEARMNLETIKKMEKEAGLHRQAGIKLVRENDANLDEIEVLKKKNDAQKERIKELEMASDENYHKIDELEMANHAKENAILALKRIIGELDEGNDDSVEEETV